MRKANIEVAAHLDLEGFVNCLACLPFPQLNAALNVAISQVSLDHTLRSLLTSSITSLQDEQSSKYEYIEDELALSKEAGSCGILYFSCMLRDAFGGKCSWQMTCHQLQSIIVNNFSR